MKKRICIWLVGAFVMVGLFLGFQYYVRYQALRELADSGVGMPKVAEGLYSPEGVEDPRELCGLLYVRTAGSDYIYTAESSGTASLFGKTTEKVVITKVYAEGNQVTERFGAGIWLPLKHNETEDGEQVSPLRTTNALINAEDEHFLKWFKEAYSYLEKSNRVLITKYAISGLECRPLELKVMNQDGTVAYEATIDYGNLGSDWKIVEDGAAFTSIGGMERETLSLIGESEEELEKGRALAKETLSKLDFANRTPLDGYTLLEKDGYEKTSVGLFKAVSVCYNLQPGQYDTTQNYAGITVLTWNYAKTTVKCMVTIFMSWCVIYAAILGFVEGIKKIAKIRKK